MRRIQCPDGDWFDPAGPCPRCEYQPPEPEPVPPVPRENFDRHVANVDRDALAVMPTERVREVHRPGIADARRALAEAEHRKGLDPETRERIAGGCR